MADSKQDELKLAQQMKDCYCDASGKETEPAMAAEIIHKLAVIYRKRNPDKIALIQSVGLFNAAIVRNPSNIARVKSDLNEICQHILQNAKANDQSVCLVKKAEQVKAQAEKLRIEIEALLEKSPLNISVYSKSNDVHGLISQKISEIREINKTVAHTYKQIMADISEFCENAMGKPPCEYAVVGMGSLARDEITPYSDFEHIILLCDDMNYETHLEYFRWFSVIFHVIILNLQETIIPSLNVDSLNTNEFPLGNWYYDAITPRGISFDGLMLHACKFPLGRTQHTPNKPFTTELIKPVNKMLEYLTTEADLKNGYHLADMLTKTCFVCGDQEIFEKFVDGVQMYLNKKSESEISNDVQRQVKDDLNKFSTRFQLTRLKTQNKINIKQFVYRSTTIFISALSTLHKISANSSFDIIDQLEQHHKISQNTANKLRYAIAIATEMRLRVYMKSKCQNDDAIDLDQVNGMKNFLNIIGTESTINYFQIAYCLQCEIAKQLNFTKLHFYSNPKLINITIGLAFGLSDLASFPEIEQHRMWYTKIFEFDTCMFKLETETKWKLTTTKTTDLSLNQLNVTANEIEKIALYLMRKNMYDEALEFYEKKLQIHQNISLDSDKDVNIAGTLNCIGMCHRNHSRNYSNALMFLHRALEIHRSRAYNADKDKCIAITLSNIGSCHIYLRNYADAMTFLNRALDIFQNITLNTDEEDNYAITLHNIGLCYMHSCKYCDAMAFYNRALEIYQIKTFNAEEDDGISGVLHSIGTCHMHISNYSDALTFLNRALEIKHNITHNADKDIDIATTLNNIGCCLVHLRNYSDAWVSLKRALEIYQNITPNADKDSNIAMALQNIGSYYFSLCNYSDALKFLNRALEIEQKCISLDANKTVDVATILKSIGLCHINLRNYSDALTIFNGALKIDQNITFDADKDCNIATTQAIVGSCRMHLRNYADALTFLIDALEIYQNITLNVDEDSNIAGTLRNIGFCHMHLCNYSDALILLHRALAIYNSITHNADKDSNIAITLNNVGSCHSSLCNYSDAMTFLNRALDIFQNITLNADEEDNYAITLHNIGLCYMHSCKYLDAMAFYDRALEIYQIKTFNADEDDRISKALHAIGTCYMHTSNYSNALAFLNRGLKIKQNITHNADKDSDIAITLNNIGSCHLHLRNYFDALTFLNRALDIFQNITLNADEESNYAITLHNIGLCHMHSCNYSDALKFLYRSIKIFQNIALNSDNGSNLTTTLKMIEECHKHLRNQSNALVINNDENSGIAMKLKKIRFFFIRLFNYCIYKTSNLFLRLCNHFVEFLQHLLSFFHFT